MKKNSVKKQGLIKKMAEYILANGLQDASLKNLAAASGTSDRMLLHYFVNKEDLITNVLDEIYRQFIENLNSHPLEKLDGYEMILHLTELMNDQQIIPYIRFWFELIPFAMKKEGPFHEIAKKISAQYYKWIEDKIKGKSEKEKKIISALVLAVTEGFSVLDMIGEGYIIQNALEGMKSFINPI